MINHLFDDDQIDYSDDNEEEFNVDDIPTEHLNSNPAQDQDLVWFFNLKQRAI